MRPGRAQPPLHDGARSHPIPRAGRGRDGAGCRGIEPRCPVLETRLIPDRDPNVDVVSVAGSAPAASGSRNRRSSKPSSTLMHTCSRLESNQHLLRFEQAPSPDRLREHHRGRVICPATGIVNYLIVKERARPSPGSLWATEESNLRRSGKNRVLRLQSL
jgi:hypothetical protein